MQNRIYNKVLLYSGGMDSWLIDKLWKPDLKLFVDMGTASAREKRKRLPADVKIVEFQSLGQFERPSDFILPLRNLYLFMIASNYGEKICLGANATDINLDKTQEFADKASDLLGYMYQPQKWTAERHPRLIVDFKGYSKSDLLAEFLRNGGGWKEAYESTFSCFTPKEGKECHGCRACFLKLMAFLDNGIEIPREIMKSYLPYIREKAQDPNYYDRIYPKERYYEILKKYDTR